MFSCVTITTKSRTWILPEAVACFEAQTIPNRELVIVCPVTHVDSLKAVVPNDPRIRVVGVDPQHTEGDRRNTAIAQTRGDWIVTWDDDDWSSPTRLEDIQRALHHDPTAQIVGCTSMWIHELSSLKTWKYIYTGFYPYLIGGTLALSKKLWEDHPYPIRTGVHDHQTGSDAALVVPLLQEGVPYQIVDTAYVALVHGGNIANPELPRYLNDPFYVPVTTGPDLLDNLTHGWLSRARKARATIHLPRVP